MQELGGSKLSIQARIVKEVQGQGIVEDNAKPGPSNQGLTEGQTKLQGRILCISCKS